LKKLLLSFEYIKPYIFCLNHAINRNFDIEPLNNIIFLFIL